VVARPAVPVEKLLAAARLSDGRILDGEASKTRDLKKKCFGRRPMNGQKVRRRRGSDQGLWPMAIVSELPRSPSCTNNLQTPNVADRPPSVAAQSAGTAGCSGKPVGQGSLAASGIRRWSPDYSTRAGLSEGT